MGLVKTRDHRRGGKPAEYCHKRALEQQQDEAGKGKLLTKSVAGNR